MYIHLPQETIFLLWNMKLFCLLLVHHWYVNNAEWDVMQKHWCWGCTEEAFVLSLHFLSHVLVCLLERKRDHLFASEDSIFCTFLVGAAVIHCWCVWLYLCVCVSDPSVAPSPASSFSTPYKKRERTLNARMYHPRQFSFRSPCFCFLLCKIIS